MVFGKVDSELGELPMLTEQELSRSPEQVEQERIEGMLELQFEYQVTVFCKWFFFILSIMTASVGLYLLFVNALLALLLIVVAVFLFRLYINRSGMAHAKHSMIGFLFLTQDELDALFRKHNNLID